MGTNAVMSIMCPPPSSNIVVTLSEITSYIPNHCEFFFGMIYNRKSLWVQVIKIFDNSVLLLCVRTPRVESETWPPFVLSLCARDYHHNGVEIAWTWGLFVQMFPRAIGS